MSSRRVILLLSKLVLLLCCVGHHPHVWIMCACWVWFGGQYIGPATTDLSDLVLCLCKYMHNDRNIGTCHFKVSENIEI